MIRENNKELIRQIGINPLKPDSFQRTNEPLINHLYLWAEQNIDISNTIQNFFNLNVRTKLIAFLLDLNLNNWVGIGASWQENNQTGLIRVDTKLTETLLNKSFGPSYKNQPFEIKNLTGLELNIIQVFLEKIEGEMKKYWTIDPDHPYLMDTIYLVWLIETDEGEIGKIAYGVPASFKPQKVQDSDLIDKTDINKLANTGIKIPISLSVGSTKLTYRDIEALESGDLLVFEDSDLSKLYWHFGEIGVVLPEEEHPIYLNSFENIEGLAQEMSTNTDNDPLSSLPLELTAEFQKVKVPLKQVLELKSGGVLPLGSILDTPLTLTAQGKPVAKGELVIVGNQFGMRIYELLIGVKGIGKSQQTVKIQSQPQEQSNFLDDDDDENTNFEDQLKELEEN